MAAHTQVESLVFNRKRNGTEHHIVFLSSLRALLEPAVPPKDVKNGDSLPRCSFFIFQSQVSNSVIIT